MSRHFCHDRDDCSECATVGTVGPTVRYDANGRWRSTDPKPPVDVSWVTTEAIGPDWAWPWWLAVPAAALRRRLP